MARPPDPARKEHLLDAAAQHVIDHGVDGLSLRVLADALGTSTTSLTHHFGNRDAMLETVLGRVRERVQAQVLDQARGAADLEGAARAVWAWCADPAHEDMFRAFYGVYGLAVQRPADLAGFLDHVVRDWIDGLAPYAEGDGGEVVRTLLVAAVRGLLLDVLATGDRDRADAAFETLLSMIDDVRGA